MKIFGVFFYISYLDFKTAAAELSRPTGLPVVHYSPRRSTDSSCPKVGYSMSDQSAVCVFRSTK